jgi:hypothetical protein
LAGREAIRRFVSRLAIGLVIAGNLDARVV